MTKLLALYKKFQTIIDYGFFGVLTTMVNFGVFYLFETVFAMSYIRANALAIFVSIIFAYFTNKKYVFKTDTETFSEVMLEFINFISFRLLSGVFDMFSMYLLIDGLHFNTNISKILTQFIVLISNYLFSKFIVFKEKNRGV